MFNSRFAHYLAYGATDQVTIRELASAFNGLVVPGTVAAFQRDGTGGFVLTLSATAESPDYVIDPRFPLFQQGLGESPKRSHKALAEILGYPGLVKRRAPGPSEFDEEVLSLVAKNWANFNLGYTKNASKKFSKYERRLNQSVVPEDSKLPKYVFPPYFIAENANDDWWELSKLVFDKTVEAVDGKVECIRVVACNSSYFLKDLLQDIQDEKVAVWVSDLDEFDSTANELAAYLQAIDTAQERGTACFALYGGFFSVLGAAKGLRGSCHGIGFGEHRNWIELPQSGPPPARYYLPQIHRYISQELAYRLWREDRRLAECLCVECDGKSPIELNYHELMKHSVWCRAMEIERWAGTIGSKVEEQLLQEEKAFISRLDNTGFEEKEMQRILRLLEHLDVWRKALKIAQGEAVASHEA